MWISSANDSRQVYTSGGLHNIQSTLQLQLHSVNIGRQQQPSVARQRGHAVFYKVMCAYLVVQKKKIIIKIKESPLTYLSFLKEKRESVSSANLIWLKMVNFAFLNKYCEDFDKFKVLMMINDQRNIFECWRF